MSDFADSYLGKLRSVIGSRMVLVPGTRVFIEDAKGRMLMQHRRDFDIWGFPGGNAEIGETLEDCIIREVREEANLEIADLTPVVFSADPALETHTFPNGDQCQFFVLMFWTKTFRGEVEIIDPESLALEWWGPANWPPMLPTMRAGLEAFWRYRQTGAFQVL